MKLLVYHSGALGDFVTTLPALAALRERFVDARITLLGGRQNGELAVAAGYADCCWDIAQRRWAALFDDRSDAAPEALRGVDGALVLATDDSPLIACLRAAGVSPLLHQPPFPQSSMHVADYHLALLGAGPWTVEQRTPRIEVPGPLPGVCRPLDPGRTVLLHAGSGSAAKNWPIERFAACARLLGSEGLAPVWLMGPVERERGPLPPRGSRVLHGLCAAQLAPLLRRTALFLGNDSGVTHLAAACGCPTVAIFGPTDPAVWAPRGRQLRVVLPPPGRPACVECVGVDAACRACRELLRP